MITLRWQVFQNLFQDLLLEIGGVVILIIMTYDLMICFFDLIRKKYLYLYFFLIKIGTIEVMILIKTWELVSHLIKNCFLIQVLLLQEFIDVIFVWDYKLIQRKVFILLICFIKRLVSIYKIHLIQLFLITHLILNK